MKLKHMLYHNGKLYKTGDDAPQGYKDGVDAPSSSPVSQEEEIPFTDTTQPAYTKTDINRMSADDLRKLASEMGVDGADGISGAELKKILIDKLGL